MKFTIIVLVLCLAVAAFAQAPPAGQAPNAQAVAAAQAAKASRGSGLGGLLTLGLLSGNMGGDAMRDMMYCNMLGISPLLCMGGVM